MSELSWVTGAELEETRFSTDIPVLVFFASASSDDSKRCLPHLEKLRDTYAGKLLFIALDVDENEEAAKRYEFVPPVTTRVFRKDSDAINVQQGVTNEKGFKELIKSSLES